MLCKVLCIGFMYQFNNLPDISLSLRTILQKQNYIIYAVLISLMKLLYIINSFHSSTLTDTYSADIKVLGSICWQGLESNESWFKKIEVLDKEYNRHSHSISDQLYFLFFNFSIIFKPIFSAFSNCLTISLGILDFHDNLRELTSESYMFSIRRFSRWKGHLMRSRWIHGVCCVHILCCSK